MRCDGQLSDGGVDDRYPLAHPSWTAPADGIEKRSPAVSPDLRRRTSRRIVCNRWDAVGQPIPGAWSLRNEKVNPGLLTIPYAPSGDRRRTSADDAHAYTAPRPSAGCQWHGRGQGFESPSSTNVGPRQRHNPAIGIYCRSACRRDPASTCYVIRTAARMGSQLANRFSR